MNNPLHFLNPNKALSRSLLLWLFAFWGVLSTPLLGSELTPSVNSANNCTAEAAQVEAVETGCFAGSLDLEATVIAEPVIPHHFEQIFLLASGANRTIVALNDQPQFTINEAGEYSIHSLVYRPSSFNPNNISLGDLRVAELALFFEQGGGVLCGALDTQGAGFHIGACPCDAEAGTLNAAGVCFDNNLAEIKSAPSGDAVIPAGFEIIYVLTSGNDLLIEGVNETPEFIVSTDKNYRIHPLVYDPSTLDLSVVEIGVTTGFDVNSLLLQGNGSICASLNVEGTQFNFGGCDACLANAGTLVADSDNCLDGEAELIASEDTAPNVPAGYEVIYVLTSGNGLVIQDVNDTPQFTVTETGLYTIHTLVYDPATLDLSIVEFGVTTGVDVNNLLIQGGGDICASLLVAGAQFQVEECPCTADAGTLLADSDNCLDGEAELIASEDTAPNVPAGYEVIYVLTSGNGLVIQEVNATPEFTVTDTGLYTIHTLVYNPLTLDLSIVEFGVTTGVDVNNLLIQGGGDICASLLVAGAQFQVEECCTADAGTLVADSDNCLDGEAELIASEDIAPNVPVGFEVIYVLTSGNGLVIQEVNATPEFTVTDTGLYTIHTLVYDPTTLDLSIVEFGVTTGVDVNNLLIQGGGDICASLLVAGAQFQVEACCTADAGTLVADSDNCLDGEAELIASEDTAPNVPAGFEVIYVLTSGNGLVIQDVNATPEFTVTDTGLYTIHTLVYNPLTLDLSIVEFGVTTGVDVNNLLIQGGGDICASLLVAGAQFQVEACCTADAGTLVADSDNCLDGEAELIASEDTAPNVPAGFEVIYVLTSGNGLVIQNVNDTPQFNVTDTGLYTIHTLVYDPATLDLSIVEFGVTTGVDVNNLLIQGGGDICASLLVAGAQFQVEACCTADAGTLVADSDNCLDGEAELIASEDTAPNVPAGYEVLYVLTSGNGLVIQEVNATPEFTVTDTGLYTIHTLVYNPLTLDLSIVEFGVTTGVDVNNLLIQGGGDICASLLVAGAQFQVEACCTADAGTLVADSDNCLDGEAELIASEDTAPNVPVGYEVLYVLTSGNGLVIQDVNDTPQFTVAETGLFTIHTLVYDPLTLDLSIVEFGVTTGVDVNNLLIQGGGDICASLLVAGAQFQVEECPCTADAGTLLADSDNCLDGEAELIASEDTAPNVPAGYEVLYVLTSGNGLVIQDVNATPEFTVTDTGLYTIHTLVYNPLTLDLSIVEFGVTTGVDVNNLLIQGGGDICASLLVAGAQFQVEACCTADAGTLVADSDNCLDGEAELIASEDTAPTVPAGYEVIYVLTSGNGLVIQDVNATPEFTVTDTGLYTIHTLVYNPATLDLSIVEFGVTTGVDVNNLLIQGGGDICASLLVAGAQFQVEACCTADAGTLVADSDNCLDGEAELIASEDTAPNVPAGFEVIYVLTSGNGLVIQDVNATPEFTVTDTGLYTIHTLVYDPLTLDLSTVEFGVTTGVDVNNLLIQGGGDICASLLVAGAQFQVEECCTADAGTLVADSDNCLDGEAELIASEDTAPNVPAGFEVIYVLTSGNGLVIQDVNATPQFTVTETGLYTIHTLVYDPATLDLSIIEFGVTTGVDVNNLLIQGGGDICASLLVAGAQFQVEACCTADAGTLVADSDNCLDGEAELIASEDTAPNVPAGFEVIYVLTSGNGLVIQEVNATPEFTVTDTGLYTIHTLVYDPATLDLSIVEFGVTTGVDVNNLLIQGGGDICASLLVAGAQFQVEECPCTADAGTLTADSDNCLDGTAELSAVEDQAPVIPNGYERLFVLTSGTDLVIEAVNTDPTFTVEETGLFTIHTLIYNPLTLDLSIVEFGVTTGVDVNGLLVQGGGDICAALDVAGATFQVEPCPTLLDKAPYPNPVSDDLFLPIADWMVGSSLTIRLNDANGKLVREIKIEEANALEVIDMRQMTPGGYTLVVYHSDGTRGMVRRIIKI